MFVIFVVILGLSGTTQSEFYVERFTLVNLECLPLRTVQQKEVSLRFAATDFTTDIRHAEKD